MSLTLAMMLIQAAPVAIETAAEEPEITIIGKKLQYWRGFLRYKNGVPNCKSKRSTGDREIDKIGCDAMIACFPKYQAELDAFAKSSKTKAEYGRVSKGVYSKISACVVDSRDAGIDALSAKRAAK